MKTTYLQTAHRLVTATVLLLLLGCAPQKALSDCDHDYLHNGGGAALPDFGFNLGGTCNEISSEASPSDNSEAEDELLQDIEEPLESSSSDLAVALEENQQTS